MLKILVTGFATYPKHPVHLYRKLKGACPWNGQSTAGSGDFSWITCRYLCDAEPRNPCIGFAYRSRRVPVQRGQPLEATNVVHGHTDVVNEPSPASVRVKPQRRQLIRPPSCVLMATLCDLVQTPGDEWAFTYIKNAKAKRAHAVVQGTTR